MAAPGPSTGGLHAHSEPPAVDAAVEAACVAALLAPHDAAVARMQSILGEIRCVSLVGDACRPAPQRSGGRSPFPWRDSLLPTAAALLLSLL